MCFRVCVDYVCVQNMHVCVYCVYVHCVCVHCVYVQCVCVCVCVKKNVTY